jgi:uncharacterized damage-inducible protein DinB
MLQPVAHALLQAVEELERFTANVPAEKLWERPADVASVGFHLMHIRGVIDRLFTYARGESLTADQLRDLTLEKQDSADGVAPSFLIDAVRAQVDKAIQQLRNTPETKLTDGRTLGRKQIPTTVIGLLFHAAEHTQRHVGQLLVTARIVRST